MLALRESASIYGLSAIVADSCAKRQPSASGKVAVNLAQLSWSPDQCVNYNSLGGRSPSPPNQSHHPFWEQLMNVTIDRQNDYVLATVSGSIDSLTLDEFRKRTQPLIEQPGCDLLIEMTELQYLNSDGLARIVELHMEASFSNSRSASPSRPISISATNLLKMAGIDKGSSHNAVSCAAKPSA